MLGIEDVIQSWMLHFRADLVRSKIGKTKEQKSTERRRSLFLEYSLLNTPILDPKFIYESLDGPAIDHPQGKRGREREREMEWDKDFAKI